jgi:hypothetical protein
MAEAKTTPIVLVTYKRETKTSETFLGSIDGAGDTHWTFHGLTFNEILERTGEVLRNSPGHRLVLKREEAPYPMLLPEDIEHLLRTDVPRAIEALTIGPQRVVVGRPRAVVSRELRHGHDTLADALGEVVYLRRRPRVVEDPSSGRWVSLTEGDGRFYCRTLPVEILGDNNRWVTAKTTDLLALGRDRYFIPRAWNATRGWITHEALASMYQSYLKEKSDAAIE